MTMTVYLGVRGGVGTTAAVAQAARRADASTMVIDLDLSAGDLAVQLAVDATSGIIDLAALGAHAIDRHNVAAVSYRLDAGARLVPSPASPELAEIFEPAHLQSLVRVAEAASDDLLVDGGSSLDVISLCACQLAGRIVFVARADSSCMRQLRTLDDILGRAGVLAPRELALPLSTRRSARSWAAEIELPLIRSSSNHSWRLPVGAKARTMARRFGTGWTESPGGSSAGQR